MKSPFPGMDPYLEMHWGDVHQSLVTYARDQMRPRLPRDLVARAQERVYFERDNERVSERYPDACVVEKAGEAVGLLNEVQVAEPYIIQVAKDPITEAFLEIRDVRTGNRVITVIEFLSPTNKKPGVGMRAYRKKQQECMDAGVSLVEIDLVRAGRAVFSISRSEIPANIRTPYQAVVRRGWVESEVEVYPLPIRERLPAIRIPLRESDSDVALDLQPLIDLAYFNGGHDSLNYQIDADPPLKGEDAEWADALLRAAGKRK